MGEMLPNGIYLLMCEGVITAKLPLVLARGRWLDKNQPLVDTQEYRQLLSDLIDYRCRALGLLCRGLNSKFGEKEVLVKTYHQMQYTLLLDHYCGLTNNNGQFS